MGKRNKDLQTLLDQAALILDSVDFWEKEMEKISLEIDLLDSQKLTTKVYEEKNKKLTKRLLVLVKKLEEELNNMSIVEKDIQSYVDNEEN